MKDDREKLTFPFYTLGRLKHRIAWIINLRWLAVLAILAVVPLNDIIFDVKIGYHQTYIVASLLLVLNIVYFFIYRYFYFQKFRQEILFAEIQIVSDLILISIFVHFIGGINNSFYFVYLIPMIISAVLFRGKLSYLNTFCGCILLTIWSILEYNNIVETYFISQSEFHLSIFWTSLLSFYFISFIITYIVGDFISKYRNLKKIIDKKSDLLEKTMRERDRMFRYTAHEIKSPINTVSSMLNIVKMVYQEDRENEDKILDLISRAQKRSGQILDIVKDMIELTHYRSGQKGGNYTQKELSDWLQKQVNSFAEEAEEKGLTLIYNSNPNSAEINFDYESLEKIVNNLISNAIRYTKEPGRIEVELTVNKQNFEITVEDNGIGIKPEEKRKIFKEFYRSAQAKDIEHLGTGLGLALVKHIVEKYQGEIELQSTPGEGSQFTIKLPRLSNI